jgi:hypothetical protein
VVEHCGAVPGDTGRDGHRRGVVGGRHRIGPLQQGRAHRGSARVPVARLLGERAHRHGREILRHVGTTGGDRRDGLVAVRVGDRHRVTARERRIPRQLRVQQAAHPVDVAGRARRLADQQLRREVGRGAHQHARHRHVGALVVERLGDAEVRELHPALVGQQHVAGLDVAVDHAGPVGRLEALEHAGGDRHHLVDLEVAAPLDQVREGLAAHELHDEVGLPVRLTGVVDGDRIGVVEPRRGPGLPHEALPGHRIRVRCQQLHRDVTAQGLSWARNTRPTAPEPSSSPSS